MTPEVAAEFMKVWQTLSAVDAKQNLLIAMFLITWGGAITWLFRNHRNNK